MEDANKREDLLEIIKDLMPDPNITPEELLGRITVADQLKELRERYNQPHLWRQIHKQRAESIAQPIEELVHFFKHHAKF